MTARKNLLFISHRIPWPLNKGEKIRGWNVINHLAKTHDVHLGCVVDDPADMAHVPHVATVCADIGAFPIQRRTQLIRAGLHLRPGRPLMPDFYYAPALQRWVDAKLAQHAFDIIYIYSVAMAPYVLQLRRPGMILDAQDIDSEKWSEYATTAAFPMKLIWAREGRTLLAYERRAAAACDVTFFVSAPEAARFAELAPEVAAKTTYIENGVDLARFAPGQAMANPMGAGQHFVFTGNMNYWPNADAVIWFAQEIFPLLRARLADAAFWVVGANPTPVVQALAALPGVHVTGRVPDTRPYLEYATASVCPLRIARGIQNKVLEAMAMGKPTIASPAAFEGVQAEAGRDLLVAGDAASFAARCAEVAAGQHPDLPINARAAMQSHYAWPAVLARLDQYLP